jgi:hypothetical protein
MDRVSGFNICGVEKNTILLKFTKCRFKGGTGFEKVDKIVNLLKGKPFIDDEGF